MALPGITLKIELKFPTAQEEYNKIVVRMRQAIRVIGRRATQTARRIAPGSHLKNKIDYVETETPRGMTSEIFMPTGLKYTLPPGTKAHIIPIGKGIAKSEAARIQREKGYPLRFYWERGPTGPHVYSFWAVSHPGYKPQGDWGQELLDQAVFIANQEMEDVSQFIGNMWEDVRTV